MLNAFALVLLQVLLDLAVIVGGLVDRDPDLPVGTGQRPAHEAGLLALDVEILDFAEVEGLVVELVPRVHVAADDVVGQVVEVEEAEALGARVRLAQPLVIRLVGAALVTVGVDEIEQRPADAVNRRGFDGLAGAGVFGCAQIDRALQGHLRVDHAPRHRGGAGAMLLHELGALAVGFGIQQVVDVALTVERDVLGLVLGDRLKAHLAEDPVENLRVGVRILDELEAVGACRVRVADRGLGGIMWERSHGFLRFALSVSPP